MQDQLVQFIVNGKIYEVQIEPRMTLLDVLRDKLNLTGTKLSCGEGGCGACTVLIEGKPVLSCLTLAMTAKGKKITTIEGLSQGPDSNANPTRQEVKEALAGNLCRCTGYVKIIDAVLDAAKRIREGAG